jgi:hypothetical protein
MMTPTERECRFEWIEAAIRWHQEQIIAHTNRRFTLRESLWGADSHSRILLFDRPASLIERMASQK